MIAKETGRKWPNIVFAGLAILLLGYTVSRAYLLSFTFDEAYSYMSYVKDTYWNIFIYKFLTSNGHVLNSLLMKLSTEVFAPSDFTLRLQSILGHVFFLLASWAILKDIKNPLFRIGGFILLNTNPFVLDFFSLARGYGLAGGLMMVSIYYLKKYLQAGSKWVWPLALCTIAAGLGAMANFTWLNYMLSMMAVVVLWAFYAQVYLKKRFFFWKSLGVLVLAGAPFLTYLLIMTIRLKVALELYYGGRKGFWADTIGTLIDSTYYYAGYPEWVTIILKAVIIGLCAGGVALLVYKFVVKKDKLQKYAFFTAVSAMLGISVLSTIIQHALFNNSFLTDRTAILFVNLFMLAVAYLLYYLYEMYKPAMAIMGLFAACAVLHFLHVMNFTHTKTWIEQADVKNVMRDLNTVRLAKDPAKNDWFFSIYWKLAPAADFYRDVYHYTWLQEVEVRQPTLKENYFFFPENDHEEIAHGHFKFVKRYPLTGFDLYENLNPTPRKVVAAQSLAIEPGEPECATATLVPKHAKEGSYSAYIGLDGYSPALAFPVGMLKGDSDFRVEGSVWVYFDTITKRCGEYVVSIEDSNKKVYQWSTQNIARDFDYHGHWTHVKFGTWGMKVRSDKDVLKVFVHNNGKYPFYVDALEAKLIK